MGRVTRRHAVLRVEPGEVIRRSDTLAVEEPLEIRLNGESYLVTMRTPGNDIDLVRGLLYSERITYRTYSVLDVAFKSAALISGFGLVSLGNRVDQGGKLRGRRFQL